MVFQTRERVVVELYQHFKPSGLPYYDFCSGLVIYQWYQLYFPLIHAISILCVQKDSGNLLRARDQDGSDVKYFSTRHLQLSPCLLTPSYIDADHPPGPL